MLTNINLIKKSLQSKAQQWWKEQDDYLKHFKVNDWIICEYNNRIFATKIKVIDEWKFIECNFILVIGGNPTHKSFTFYIYEKNKQYCNAQEFFRKPTVLERNYLDYLYYSFIEKNRKAEI